jgi:hypothetical protein
MKKDSVYVVTRGGRRIEGRNYQNKADASYRAKGLRALLKKWKDPDCQKVSVTETTTPNRIR